MTAYDPESVPDESSEGDFVDQHTDVVDDPDVEPDTEDLTDNAWGADVTDVADQRTPAPIAEHEE